MTDQPSLQQRLDAALAEHPGDSAAQADLFFSELTEAELEIVRWSLALEVERRWPTDDDEEAP